MAKTPQRTKLIDAFMAFLMVVGGLQFVYCVVAGNYVSSYFFVRMAGFSCCDGWGRWIERGELRYSWNARKRGDGVGFAAGTVMGGRKEKRRLESFSQ